MLRNVAVLVMDDVAPFELGVLCEVFGVDRSDQGLPDYDFAVCSPGGRTVTTTAGFTVAPTTPWTGSTRPTSSAYRRWARTSQVPDEVRRRAAPGRRPRRLGDERLLGRLRARARPACSTAGAAPRTGCTPTSWPQRVPERERRPRRAVRAGRPAGHQRRYGGRHRRLPAHRAPGARRRGRQRRRPPDGRAAAPRRRPAPVRRDAGPRRRGWRDAGPAARLAGRAPGRAAHGRDAGRARAHVAAHVRAPVPGRDRHHAVRVAHRASGCCWPSGCWRRRTSRSTWSRARSGFGTAPVLRHHFGQSRHTTPQAFRRAFKGDQEAAV